MHLILAITIHCGVFGADLAKSTLYLDCPQTKTPIEVQNFQTPTPVTAPHQPTGKLKP